MQGCTRVPLAGAGCSRLRRQRQQESGFLHQWHDEQVERNARELLRTAAAFTPRCSVKTSALLAHRAAAVVPDRLKRMEAAIMQVWLAQLFARRLL